MKVTIILLLMITVVMAEYGEEHNDYKEKEPQVEIIVNRSTYTTEVFIDDELLSTHRTIVGKKGRSTPILETEVISIEINPDWNVPESLTDDVVRKLKRKENPIAYIERNGYKFIINEKEIDPTDIDWNLISSTGPYAFKIIQDAGKLNVLGNVMFVLKDTGGIQMHGTNTPALFDNDERRFSSGCIRVDNINVLAAFMANKTDDQFTSIVQSKKNTWIRPKYPIKIRVVE